MDSAIIENTNIHFRQGVTPLIDMRRLSFRRKLKYAFVTVTILSILITGGSSYYITTNIIENNALKLTQDSVIKSAQIVDEKLNKLMLVMMTFMISNPFRNMLKDVSTRDQSQYFAHLADLDNVFSQARIAEPLIHSIYISTPMGEFYPLSMNRNRQTSFTDTLFYERIQQEKKNIWIEGHEDELFLGKERVISLILVPISDMPVQDVYVVVNIREEGLRQLVGPETEGGSIRFLLNAEARLVTREPARLVNEAVNGGFVRSFIQQGQSGYMSYDLGQRTYLFNYAHLGIANWTVMAIQSKDHVLQEMIYVKWMIVSITAAAFLITLFVSGAFTRYLLKPLQGLLLVMKRVESNDLSARFHSKHEDELAQVGRRFNRMLEQIVRLIGEVKDAEANKRAAEIKALSAQMDPHFLYNTLNTIYWRLDLQQVEPSQKMVVSLSRLFQLGLNKGHEITTLDKEIQHVEEYLKLQMFCYEQLFDYDIQVTEPWLLGLPVPRIMLQPLVENSILHGFESMESGGHIAISVQSDKQAGFWTMEVKDNGQGMGVKTVQTLHRQEAGQGYAIGNLISRLQLYYGDEAKLSIQSVPQKGTIMTITIPLKGEHANVQP